MSRLSLPHRARLQQQLLSVQSYQAMKDSHQTHVNICMSPEIMQTTFSSSASTQSMCLSLSSTICATVKTTMKPNSYGIV